MAREHKLPAREAVFLVVDAHDDMAVLNEPVFADIYKCWHHVDEILWDENDAFPYPGAVNFWKILSKSETYGIYHVQEYHGNIIRYLKSFDNEGDLYPGELITFTRLTSDEIAGVLKARQAELAKFNMSNAFIGGVLCNGSLRR